MAARNEPNVSSRRHWLVTLSSVICFATALAFVFSLLYHPREASFRGFAYWSYTWLWSVLSLFPQPASLSGLLLLFRPWSAFLGNHTSIAISTNLLFVLFSAALGWALWTRRPWAKWILAALSVFQIPVALGNIAIYGQQFTYCAEGTIYSCSKNLLARLIPYYGFSFAGIVVSVSVLVFLWRYGLNSPATCDATGAVPVEQPDARQSNGLVNASRWVIVVIAALIAADYSYFAVLWAPILLRRNASGHELPIQLVLPLIFFAIASYATVIVRLVRRPDRFAFALAAGTSLACALAWLAGIGAEETLGVPFFLGLGVWRSSLQYFSGASALSFLSVGIYLAVVMFAFAGLWKQRPTRRSSPGMLGAGFVLPLVVAIAWPQVQTNLKTYTTFSRFPKPTARQQAANDVQTAALHLVRAYGHCAFQYRRAHAGQGFPASASLIGPGGTGCLSASELTPQLDGYQLRYEAAPSDPQGAVSQFHLFVMKTAPTTAYDLGYFLDASGLITGLTRKSVQYNSPGNDPKQEPPPEDPLRRAGPLYSSATYWVRGFQDCLNRIRDSDLTKQYPATLEPLLDTVAAYGNPCIPPYIRVGISRSDFRSNLFTMTFNSVEHWDDAHPEPRYTFQYSVRTDPAGKRTGYVLTARPVTYNEDGVRSYYSDETQKLRWASEERTATPEDAELLPCELAPMVLCLDAIPQFSASSRENPAQLKL